MFQTIVVPFDGSEQSAYALPYAAALARAARGTLILTYAPAPWELELDAPARLYASATELQATGTVVMTRITPAPGTSPGRAILAATRASNADLIVMGTHAYGTVGRALFGSVADTVVRHATVPVLVCTAQADHRWPEDRPRRILVPLDGSPLAETALPHARRLAQQFGASLDLAGIVDQTIVAAVDQGVQVGDYPAMLRAETWTYLERRANELRNDAAVVDVHALVGVPSAAICQLADDLHSDVIVMATHGRGGVARLLLGSVALHVLQQTRVPVLLVQPAVVAAERRAEGSRLASVVEDQAPAPARSEAMAERRA